MWMLAELSPEPPPEVWIDVVRNLTDTGSLFMFLIFGIPSVAIIMGTLKSVLGNRARERTRQEVAAYVAEGSMSAEEGERLLHAGSSSTD